MSLSAVKLHAVESHGQRAAARALVTEYLRWVAEIAHAHYGLSFDIDAMVRSDLDDQTKFFPPTGRFYLIEHANSYIGVGCLKHLAPAVGEIQRMYVQPQHRDIGAGRMLLLRLIEDARSLGCARLRLESLKALTAAHTLYRSAGFVEIDPYADNSMKEYQPPQALDAYRASALFMELSLEDG